MAYAPRYVPEALKEDVTSLFRLHDLALGTAPTELVGHGTGLRAATVIATVAGCTGDLGFASPLPIMMQLGLNNAHVSTPHGYAHALQSRIGSYGPQKHIVSTTPFFRGGHFGLDTRHMVPPFSPHGRGEDIVFGVLLFHMYGPGGICHIPAQVEHLPKSATAFSPGAVSSILHRFNDIVVLLLNSIDEVFDDMSPDEILVRIGRHIERIARYPISRYRAFVKDRFDYATDIFEQILSSIRARLPGELKVFDADADQLLHARRMFARNRNLGVASDLPGSDDSDAQERHLRTMEQFGTMLRLWPDLWRASMPSN